MAFMFCFVIGFLAAAIVTAILSRFSRKRNEVSPCATAEYFNSPEEVLAALRHPEVEVRRAIFSQLLLRPDISTIYYDYERDLDYPERADRARLQYLQLDDSPGQEALLTFVRFEHPVALVFKQKSCGWRLVGALSSWLRFEDYPYDSWLSLCETIEPGIRQLLVRDSYSDASSYVRKARVLRLNDEALTQVAEIEEESIQRVDGYEGSNWSDLKLRRVNKYSFTSGNIRNDITEEIIKLNGPSPQYSYWLETDGSWHARQSNWSRRPAKRVKLLSESTEVQWWNSQEGRFIKQ
jgi:Arc/MetJ-type ribon-helix-helix transcriptional regulator